MDGFIEQVGATTELPATADEIIDLTGHVVLPGLVNTHHHFYQTLTRAVPGAQDAGLFDWLTTLYPIWARMTSEHIRVSTQVALAELALSGCTTAFDHLYLFPNDSTLDDEIDALTEADIDAHVHKCRECYSRAEFEKALRKKVATTVEIETPNETRGRLEALIKRF